MAGGFCGATTAATQVQQGELSDRVLGHRVGAPIGRAGFCFGLGAGEEGEGVFLNHRLLFVLGKIRSFKPIILAR